MNLYDYAEATEQSGIRFYRRLALRARNEGVKKVFGMLAEDERHMLEKLRTIRRRFPDIAKVESDRLHRGSNVFTARSGELDQEQIDTDLDAYRTARDTESELVRVYREAADAETDPRTREMLGWLAALEEHELHQIEQLCDFVAAPESFLEWGEFSNLDEFHNFGRYDDLRRGELTGPTTGEESR